MFLLLLLSLLVLALVIYLGAVYRLRIKPKTILLTPKKVENVLPIGPSNPLKVGILNICILPYGTRMSLFENKSERIASFLKYAVQYDVILLQEYWGCFWSSFHLKFLQDLQQAGYYVAYTSVGFVSDTGNVIASRYPISGCSVLNFENVESWQRCVSNGVLYAKIMVPKKDQHGIKTIPFHSFSIHLHSNTLPQEHWSNLHAKTIREKQLQELKQFMSHCFAQKDDSNLQKPCYMVAGDFNIRAPSKEYDSLVNKMGSESLLSQIGFRKTYDEHHPITPPGWKNCGMDLCLDHCFTNIATSKPIIVDKGFSDHLLIHFTTYLKLLQPV